VVKTISGYPVITLSVLAIAFVLARCPNPAPPTLDQVGAPTFSPAAGVYGGDQSVTIGCSTSGATIYYTTDGMDPNTSSAAYSSAIAVAGKGSPG
jgi:hypothetical protein